MIRSVVAPRLALTPRPVIALAALILAGASLLTIAAPAPPSQTTAAVPPLSERLGPRTWALAIPVSWLSAPIPGLRHDDVLDLLGARPSERATTSEVATGVRVMAFDERTLVIELTAEDAAAVASARARGLALIPILRSTR